MPPPGTLEDLSDLVRALRSHALVAVVITITTTTPILGPPGPAFPGNQGNMVSFPNVAPLARLPGEGLALLAASGPMRREDAASFAREGVCLTPG